MQTTKRNDQPGPLPPPDLQQALREAAELTDPMERVQRIEHLTAEAVARGYRRAPIDTSRLQELRQQCAERRAPQ